MPDGEGSGSWGGDWDKYYEAEADRVMRSPGGNGKVGREQAGIGGNGGGGCLIPMSIVPLLTLSVARVVVKWSTSKTGMKTTS
jgi:hypothetical protein